MERDEIRTQIAVLIEKNKAIVGRVREENRGQTNAEELERFLIAHRIEDLQRQLE